MRLARIWREAALMSLAVASWAAFPATAPAQESKTGQDSRKSAASKEKGSNASERASGVIVKVEPIKESSKDRAATHHLTINTNVVWRDWARDQALVKDTGPAKKDSDAGKNSIATRGEPADRNSLVVVDVVADTRVETRFRSPQNETSKGSKTPETKKGNSSAKPVQFRVDDLKPGLFVEVDFRSVSSRNPASTISVIRPIADDLPGSTEPAR